MIVQSNQQVSDMIKRGERVIAAGALDSYAAEDRKDGHPIETIYPSDGTYVIPSPTSVVKGSPNPNAGKLLAEFMISDEVQKLFPEEGSYAARADMRATGREPGGEGYQADQRRLRLPAQAGPDREEEVQRDLPVSA